MVDTQPISHTVDEVEVAGDEASGADLGIIPSVLTQA
jgi:hypothetical protein